MTIQYRELHTSEIDYFNNVHRVHVAVLVLVKVLRKSLAAQGRNGAVFPEEFGYEHNVVKVGLAVKGHVAVEFFFHKLKKRGRIIVDTITRLVSIAFFGLLAYRCVLYGIALQSSGDATPTLQIPTFWIMHVIAFCCVVVTLVIFEHLIHPGKELIKP